MIQELSASETSIFPACAVTRAAAKRALLNQEKMGQTPDNTATTGTSESFDSAATSQISQMALEHSFTKHCLSMK